MMKKLIKDEKGSFAIVLVMILIISIAVVSLTQYLFSEQTTARQSTEIQLNSLYQKDKVIEIVNNVLLQKIMQKEWEDEIYGEKLLSNKELYDIEKIINDTILKNEKSEIKIEFSNLQSPDLKDYCQMKYTEGFNQLDEKELFLSGYHCFVSPVDIKVDVNLKRGNSEEKIKLFLDDFYFATVQNDSKIVVNKSEIFTGIY